MGDVFTPAHRSFLRFFAAKPIRILKTTQEHFDSLRQSPEFADDFRHIRDLNDMRQQINRATAFMGLELREIIYENNSEKYWGLANARSSDPIAKMASEFTEEVVAYFKALLRKLVINNGILLLSDAIDARSDGELKNKVRFSAPRTEAVIKQLVNTWWLAMSDDDRKVLIGPRSYVDLRSYLEDAAEGLQDYELQCLICQETCISGVKCMQPRCLARLHLHCGREWFRDLSKANECPLCRQQFSEQQPE